MTRALLINWDNYPNIPNGGVYTWVKNLVDSMPDWEFVVLNQLSNSNANSNYKIPPQVRQVIEIPIFGTTRLEEYCEASRPLLPKILRTNGKVIKRQFLPLFKDLLANLIADRCDLARTRNSLFELRTFLLAHDSKKCFEYFGTWEIFRDALSSDPIYREMELREAITAFQVFQRGLQILAVPLPEVDLIHCSLAWLPSLVAVCEKMEKKTPLLLTEHGVAFRELLLYYNAYLRNEPAKILWKVLSRNVVQTLYSVADLILPVCRANEEWEKKLGADPSKIKVIYNGVDTQRFKPMEISNQRDRPTVVSVARVDIFKDIVGLMQSIKYAREAIPNIQCLLYGGSIDLDYSLRCEKVLKSLQLQANFTFMGKTSQPELAYNSGDIVAFTAITEGFPFAVIEAMACGKAIVASDVGGVREALDGCGLLVRSRRPKEVGGAIVRLLQNEDLRDSLGRAALKRVQEQFTLDSTIKQYKQLYQNLSSPQSRAEEERQVITA
jgi:polysaccharide biosynthesis protein PelF